MACHAVLWIPTIVYRGFSTPITSSIEKNISDIPDKEFFVRVSLQDNGDVLIEKRLEQATYSELVTLTREDASANGMISYTYKSTTDKESGFRFTTKEFPTAIYHIIKSFYHKHEFHDGDNDSSLPPFVTSSKVDIHTADNPALQHYLKKYCDVISAFANYLQLAIRRTRARKRDVELEVREFFQSMCLMARGYELYLGVLYQSKYNTKCVPCNMEDRDLRHMACNIENGLRYIRLVEYEYGEYQQQAFVGKVLDDAAASVESSQKSIEISQESNKISQDSIRISRRSIKVGWVSIAIGIASLVTAFFISRQSTKELNQVKDSLQHQLDSIPVFIKTTEEQARELYQKQEIISETQRSVDEKLKKIEDRLYILLYGQE